mmetsp:Transcript_16934/g.27421  ORF Transcript_16934/g.27421 Transcript_16934/m.27421 type:complete len:448 (-) Transcript_16934:412-1755(-)|eukprot:CAMPEP_0203755948 /NCGR_PEP_ID=MMETSP0098-20131031/9285_1 /ASSEMBLY_ACC=CAM_ASM_000208 /TAXON_ID=96639 /ORGANISM=" , Strain NY0313808BC1" /LENGTH=447 /DNA_ID=CAMNT_0050647595 /DNA_START=116 /DNA_END=1459 /DNA_ORIENTATION=-
MGEYYLPAWVFGLVCLAGSMESADETILPASYHAIGNSLGIAVTALGSLTFGRTIMQSSVCLFIGPIIDRYPSLYVISIASFTWGVCTVGVAMSSSYYEILFFRSLTGLCLAMAIPSLTMFTSRLDASKRVKGFGWMGFGGSIGGLFAGALATSVGEQRLSFMSVTDVEGWRAIFTGFGVASVVLGLILFKANIVVETEREIRGQAHVPMINDYFGSIRECLSLRTFQGILVQGVVGCMPWKSFAFLTLIFQSAGFTDAQAAMMSFAFRVGCTIGGVIGAYIAQHLYKLMPNRGLIITAQISAGSQLPLSYLCLRYFPHTQEYYSTLLASFFVLGLFMSWCGSVNNCILSDVCKQESRNAIFALNYGIQGSISSLAIPIVAYLSKPADNDGDPFEMSEALSQNVFNISAFASVFLVFVYHGITPYYTEEKANYYAAQKYKSVHKGIA